MSIERVFVAGAGLMGHGIAQVFALGGHDVTITDSFTANLETVKARINANLADLGDDAANHAGRHLDREGQRIVLQHERHVGADGLRRLPVVGDDLVVVDSQAGEVQLDVFAQVLAQFPLQVRVDQDAGRVIVTDVEDMQRPVVA